jgi:hypothetical protein
MNDAGRIGERRPTITMHICGSFIVKILSRRKPGTVNIARNMLRKLRLIFGIIKGLMNGIERIALNTIVNIAGPIQSGMLRTSTTAEHVSSKQEVVSPLKSG